MTDNKVDILVHRIDNYANKIRGNFGLSENGAKAKPGKYKIIMTTDYKVPCKIIMINKTLLLETKN